jgi:hypothetical protein
MFHLFPRLHPRQFLFQLLRLMDQRRQALRADKNFPALIVQMDKRNLLFGFLTVQASFHKPPIEKIFIAQAAVPFRALFSAAGTPPRAYVI